MAEVAKTHRGQDRWPLRVDSENRLGGRGLELEPEGRLSTRPAGWHAPRFLAIANPRGTEAVMSATAEILDSAGTPIRLPIASRTGGDVISGWRRARRVAGAAQDRPARLPVVFRSGDRRVRIVPDHDVAVVPATTKLPEAFSFVQTAANAALAMRMASSQRWFTRKRRMMRNLQDQRPRDRRDFLMAASRSASLLPIPMTASSASSRSFDLGAFYRRKESEHQGVVDHYGPNSSGLLQLAFPRPAGDSALWPEGPLSGDPDAVRAASSGAAGGTPC